MPDKSLFVVQYQVKPLPASDAFATCTGAYANAWIDAPTESEAVSVAAAEIKDAGWSLESHPEVSLVSRTDYGSDESGLEYFEQALLDGTVLVFHTWRELH